MKKLVLILILIIGIPATAWSSPYLAIDVPTDVTPTASKVDVNGVVEDGIIQLSIDGLSYLVLDLSTFPKGLYTFRISVRDDLMWWNDWSDPFTAGKPAKSGNVRIVNE